MIYGLTYEQVSLQISTIANIGSVNMPDLWNLDPFLFILMFALMSLLLFYFIDRVGWQRKERGE